MCDRAKAKPICVMRTGDITNDTVAQPPRLRVWTASRHSEYTERDVPQTRRRCRLRHANLEIALTWSRNDLRHRLAMEQFALP